MNRDDIVMIDGIPYSALISDEEQVLLAAKAAGRPVVGLWSGHDMPPIGAAEYVMQFEDAQVEKLTQWERDRLERIVRRQIGKPWMIAETDRLLIREFTEDDSERIPAEPEDSVADEIFRDRRRLKDYIEGQYRFYEYGIWALVERASGDLIGKAGLTKYRSGDYLELGYHIFLPYRRKGYAYEACTAILRYAREELKCPVCARIEQKNRASAQLAQKLGFRCKSGDLCLTSNGVGAKELLYTCIFEA